MAVKQRWMSRDTRRKSRYGLRLLGGVFGIALLALALVCGGVLLGFRMGWPPELFSVLLCLGVTALMVVLALRLGRRCAGDATMFFLTEEERLFAVDARDLAQAGGALLSQAAAGRNVQRHLRKLACLSEVPAQAEEILNVERIREHGSHYALHCRVRRLDCRVIRRTYVLAKSMEDQERLLRQLERRERGVWP